MNSVNIGNMSIQINSANSGFITHPQASVIVSLEKTEPPVILVSLKKTEPPTVIKSEPPESEIVEMGLNDIVDFSDEKITSDIKYIDIVSHMLCEDLIKSETFPKNILETNYPEFVETQVIVKTENAPFAKIESVTQSENLIKIEDTSDENVIRGTGQGVLEVQGSNEYFNTVDNLETNEHLEQADFAKCYKTIETISWGNNKEKIQVIEAPVIPVEPHEYTRLAKNKYMCNHCQFKYTTLNYIKCHIKTMHRKVTRMFQCLYCPFKSKWRSNLRVHIIQKHKDNQWFEYSCNECDYKHRRQSILRRHKLIHLKSVKIRYFFCDYCPFKCKQKVQLKHHIFEHCKNKKTKHPGNLETDETTSSDEGKEKIKVNEPHVIPVEPHEYTTLTKDYHACNHCQRAFCTLEYVKVHIHRMHRKVTGMFQCPFCSFKSKWKSNIRFHFIQKHKITKDIQCFEYRCDKCDYSTFKHQAFNTHKLVHLKPEETQYFYCYHCSYKSKQMSNLKTHILRHFKNENVPFHCYICNFMTLKRELIIEHIKTHSKVELETHTTKSEKRYYCEKYAFIAREHSYFKPHG